MNEPTDIYVTSTGDTVDRIAWLAYNSTNWGYVQAIFRANPGLAERGLQLEAGLRIRIPRTGVTVDSKRGRRLWD